LKGWVQVNGATIREKGYRVSETDQISLNTAGQKAQKNRLTVLLNKPPGYVSAQAEKGYPAAAGLITVENRWKRDNSPFHFSAKLHVGLAPAGRLDIDSVGLLVLTQD